MTQDDAGSAPMLGSQCDAETQHQNVTRSELIGEVIRATEEIRDLYALIDRTAKAWLKCADVAWQGDIADAMEAAVAEIKRLRLTDAEREAIQASMAFWSRGYGPHGEALRALLERLG